jgi:hypothetical protein
VSLKVPQGTDLSYPQARPSPRVPSVQSFNRPRPMTHALSGPVIMGLNIAAQ